MSENGKMPVLTDIAFFLFKMGKWFLQKVFRTRFSMTKTGLR